MQTPTQSTSASTSIPHHVGIGNGDDLRNAWSVAAWSSEVGRHLLERTLLDQPVLLYRKENGEAVAIGNACAHRLAPLSMGKLIGDSVQCPYHGLRFDSSGACTHNPHADGMVPPRMRVPQYTLVERHGMIWLWLGDADADADAMDPATIPDFSCHLDPELAFVGGVIELTPKDATTTYYFWGITRGYKIDDAAAGELRRQIIEGAFEGQDRVIIEAQQRMLGSRTLDQAQAVMFASDVAAQRARKLLTRLVEQQATPQPQNTALQDLRHGGHDSHSPVSPVV